MSKKESLDLVYEEIARLSSQCPSEFRSEANRVEFLKKAVRDEQWALSTLESHMTTPMNFTTLHTRLSSAIVLHEELATRNAPARPNVYTAQVIPTYYGEQYTRITTHRAAAILHQHSHAATAVLAPQVRRPSYVGTAERQDTSSTYARNWQRDEHLTYYATESRQVVIA
jgi:hypothetical protein